MISDWFQICNMDWVNIQLYHHVVRKSWLLSSQMPRQPELRISCFYSGDIFHRHQPDSKQSQINFKFATYRLSLHPPSSSCCEEELGTLCLGGTAAYKRKNSYCFDWRGNFITTSQMANNLRLLSNLQHRLSVYIHLHHHAVRKSWVFSSRMAQQSKCKISYFYGYDNFITCTMPAR